MASSRRRGTGVARGVFGALMALELVNDGPVTIVLE
jgi:D-Tyr-tRNAtyr deacylase